MYEDTERFTFRDFKELAVIWGGIFLAIACFQIAYLLLKPELVSIFEFLTSKPRASIFAVVGVVATGIALFIFRKHARLAYGICEVAFGIVWAWSVVSNLDGPNPKSDVFALMAVLYLIVRGLDNCDEGQKIRKAKNFASEFAAS